MPYYRHPCSAASFQAPSGGEKRLSPGSFEPSEPSEPSGTRGRVRGPFSRGDGANLESREARVTQIRGLDVATLARFGRSENSAWGWSKSGVPACNSHADPWPRCRHARTVLPFWFSTCNSHRHSGSIYTNSRSTANAAASNHQQHHQQHHHGPQARAP